MLIGNKYINMNYIQSDFERIYKLYYPKMFGFAKNYVGR